MADTATVGVLTAGAWGTALAQTMARAGNKVLVWDRDVQVVDDINQRHENRKRYPGIKLDDKVMATDDVAAVTKHCDVIVVAAPSDVNPYLAAQLAARVEARHVLVLASKGFRESDGALLSTIWQEACPQAGGLCVLTGPSFARELMHKQVTAFTVAGSDSATVGRVADLFDVPFVRAYEHDDVLGAQVGGALKNVLAIASGILDGLEMGYNARAAMLSRGLVEMGRYAKLMGGRAETVMGLTGMGDLLLTATSELSRNYRFGQLIGKGVPLHEAKLKIGTVEGILAARIVTVQAQAHGVDLAVMSAIDGVLHGDVTPLKVVDYLMRRPRKREFDA
ncbi:MAG: NAD(P)-dependent glycerol-3-phosphate dehydrogenase [Pseudomonadaceae bacterium]|nr:NAD(P)-dependent glycerol-3-phosphate dehydrogenase [Pseudomonadaceae bacterium]